MSLLLLFGSGPTGPAPTVTKGYATASDLAGAGSAASNARAKGATASDAAASGSTASNA